MCATKNSHNCCSELRTTLYKKGKSGVNLVRRLPFSTRMSRHLVYLPNKSGFVARNQQSSSLLTQFESHSVGASATALSLCNWLPLAPRRILFAVCLLICLAFALSTVELPKVAPLYEWDLIEWLSKFTWSLTLIKFQIINKFGLDSSLHENHLK